MSKSLSVEKVANDSRIDVFTNECVRLGVDVPPKDLYHYTTVQTLRSITSTKEVWMTHIHDMRNDTQEFFHGMRLFRDAIVELQKAGIDPILCRSWKKFFNREMKSPHAAPSIFCLTSVRDGKRQWQSYGCVGKGISVAIDLSTFGDPVNVIYDVSAQEALVRNVVQRFIQFIQRLISQRTDVNAPPYVRALFLCYFQISYLQSARLKRWRFNHEQEWRIVVPTGLGTLEVRKGGWLKPRIRYLRRQTDLNGHLKEITTGPMFDDFSSTPFLQGVSSGVSLSSISPSEFNCIVNLKERLHRVLWHP